MYKIFVSGIGGGGVCFFFGGVFIGELVSEGFGLVGEFRIMICLGVGGCWSLGLRIFKMFDVVFFKMGVRGWWGWFWWGWLWLGKVFIRDVGVWGWFCFFVRLD